MGGVGGPVIADGAAVAIVKGAHKGKTGAVVSHTSSMKSVYVEIAGEAKPVLVRTTSVEPRHPAVVVSNDGDSDEARGESPGALRMREVDESTMSSLRSRSVCKQTDVMRIPDASSPDAGLHFGSARIGSLYAATSDDLIPDNFLRYFLKHRVSNTNEKSVSLISILSRATTDSAIRLRN